LLVNLTQIQIDKIKSLIRGELGYLSDNRLRYKIVQDREPDRIIKTANGYDFKDIIKDHDAQIWILNEIIKSLEK
jgi:hypothetical protein